MHSKVNNFRLITAITRSLSAALLATVFAAGGLGAQKADTVRMALLWSVVEGEHATADSLGILTGIAMDAKGTVYVSDREENKIWVFDARGRSARGIGRRGQGPGEFQAPTGIAIGPGNKLYVRDQNNVSRFVVDAQTGRLTKFETRFNGGTMSDWMSTLASRFDTQGRMYYPSFNQGGLTSRMGQWRVFSTAGVRVDSIAVPFIEGTPPKWASVRESEYGGRILRGLNHAPFAGLPAWDVTSRGTVIYTNGREYLIKEVDRSGRVIREIRRNVAPIRIPAAERRDSLTALRLRRDSIANVPRSMVSGVPDDVWKLELPETYPPIRGVYAAPDGLIWVRRWVPNGYARTVFDVLEADGRLKTVVVLPGYLLPDITPVLSLNGVAGIGADLETGAMTVLRFGVR